MALGRAVYQLNGLEWLVIEVARRLDPTTKIDVLAGMTSMRIAEQLSSKVRHATGLMDDQISELQHLAAEYAQLPDIRNNVAHARPATTPNGRQRVPLGAEEGALPRVDRRRLPRQPVREGRCT